MAMNLNKNKKKKILILFSIIIQILIINSINCIDQNKNDISPLNQNSDFNYIFEYRTDGIKLYDNYNQEINTERYKSSISYNFYANSSGNFLSKNIKIWNNDDVNIYEKEKIFGYNPENYFIEYINGTIIGKCVLFLKSSELKNNDKDLLLYSTNSEEKYGTVDFQNSPPLLLNVGDIPIQYTRLSSSSSFIMNYGTEDGVLLNFPADLLDSGLFTLVGISEASGSSYFLSSTSFELKEWTENSENSNSLFIDTIKSLMFICIPLGLFIFVLKWISKSRITKEPLKYKKRKR